MQIRVTKDGTEVKLTKTEHQRVAQVSVILKILAKNDVQGAAAAMDGLEKVIAALSPQEEAAK